MKPFEILLSESQERMLVIGGKGREKEILDVFEKWDLNCEQIGEVTDSGILRYFMGKELVAEVPAESLVLGGGAPVYTREMQRPAYMDEIEKFSIKKVPQGKNLPEIAEFILSLPSIASKRWVTQQYDSMVGTANMTTNIPSDAAVIHVEGTEDAIVVTTDCNSRYVRSNPEIGCAMAVAEAVRNIACTGGEPIGVTNCLNFGNPYNPEVYFQFANAIMGMKRACEKFGTPVTGGNVSFYNQSSDDGPVNPTPTIGMVGLMQKAKGNITGIGFQKKGNLLYLVGKNPEDLGCSEYIYHYHKIKNSPPPYFNLDDELRLYVATRRVNANRLAASAHDISEGGLLVCLMESGFVNGLGFDILTDDDMRLDAFLFGEAAGRIVFSVDQKKQEEFEDTVEDAGVPLLLLGEITGGDIIVDGDEYGHINDFKEVYESAIENRLK
jgi:phosphoribosylformylglycinamidine synthase